MSEGTSPAVFAGVERVPVAIEVPHGPVVEALLERGFAVHSINPKQLDRFRGRFSRIPRALPWAEVESRRWRSGR